MSMATKWHYRVLTGDLSQAELDQIGNDGWELVAVTAAAGKPIVYFKRPHPTLKEAVTLEQRDRYLAGRDGRGDTGG
jgi:hypothetical protein